MTGALVVARFAKGEWDVAILDHVLDLAAHGEGEENDEVYDLSERQPFACFSTSLCGGALMLPRFPLVHVTG